MYKTGCFSKVREYIFSLNAGEVFSLGDLKAFGASTAVRKAVSRLAEQSLCLRVLPGIYCATLTLEANKCIPRPSAVADAIARNNCWTIVPASELAQFALGLTDSNIPRELVYISTGPTVEYEFGNEKIIFRHSKGKFMHHAEIIPAMVISALRDLKDVEALNEASAYLSKTLDKSDKADLMRVREIAPARLRPIFDQICSS